MTPPAPHGTVKGAAAGFAEARAAAEKAGVVQQRQAARRVAEHSRDADDCLDLLMMLGLSGLAPTTTPRPALPPRNRPVGMVLPAGPVHPLWTDSPAAGR